MLRFLLLGIILWYVFRFVLRFILPVVKITSAVKGHMKNTNQPTGDTAPKKGKRTPKSGEYIDYEMVK